MKDINEEDGRPARSTKETQHCIDLETSANSWLLQTKTIKTKKIQELVIPKISKKANSIKAMTGQERFDIRKIFDLLLEVTDGKFFDHLDTAI